MNSQLRFLRPYIRGLPLIVAAMVAGYVVAVKYLSYTTPMYEATTKIKLADLNEGATGNNLFRDLDVFASTNKIATEIEVLKSQALLEKALGEINFSEELSRIGKLKTKEIFVEKPFLHQLTVRDPDLYNVPWLITVSDTMNFTVRRKDTTEEFSGTFGTEVALGYGASLLLSLNYDLLSSKPNLEVEGEYQLIRYSEDRLVSLVAGALDIVSVDKDVAVLKLIYKSPVPEKAALFTNHLAQTYISDYIEEKFKTADVTADFLDQQIAEVYRSLSNAEMKIEGYRVENNIINIRQETETDLRKISQLKIQQTNVRMSLEAIEELDSYMAEGKEDFLRLAPNFEAFTDLLSTEMIKKIKELQLEKADLLLTYKSNHELVANVDKKIQYYTDYFLESIHNTRNNLQTKYAELTRDIEEAEKVFVGLPERERMLTILDREFAIHQQAYIFLNEKRIEAEIARAAQYAFHRVIHEAGVPREPVSPNRPIIIIVSVLLGMMGAIIVLFLWEMATAKAGGPESVEEHTDVPVLYAAPHMHSPADGQAFFKTQVLKMDRNGLIASNGSLAVTGFSTKNAARYHLRELGAVLRKEQRNIILLTFDPAYYASLPTGSAVLLTKDDMAEMTFGDLQGWFRQLCAEYDLVLVDNFTLEAKEDAEVVMSLVHQNICVVDTRRTSLKQLGGLNTIALKSGLENLHIAINNLNYTPSPLRIVRKLFAGAGTTSPPLRDAG